MSITESTQEQDAEAWKTLQDRGVTDKTPVSLELYWYTRDQESANNLARELGGPAFQSVNVRRLRDEWSIKAETVPRPFTLASLQAFAKEMSELGGKHHCEFDGWSAAVPQPSKQEK